MIQIEGVSKTYDKAKVKALDDISFTVKGGEVFGFLGPNGAGKTTLIKLVTGVLNIQQGRISIDGADIAKETIAAKKKIGYVPDSAELFDRLTGYEYLTFMADVYGVDAKDRKALFDRELAYFSLLDAAGAPIKSYSRGMKQKLSVIASLLHKPSVWILDEPMVGLDPQSGHRLKQRMVQERDRGVAVFFSTHVLEVAEKLCDRVAIINKGRLVAIGTLEELRHGDKSESLEEEE